MRKTRRAALLFTLAGLCFLFVGTFGFQGKSIRTYGNIVAGILFLLVALREYRRKDAP